MQDFLVWQGSQASTMAIDDQTEDLEVFQGRIGRRVLEEVDPFLLALSKWIFFGVAWDAVAMNQVSKDA